MKTAKSLLVASATSLVAIGGAQAADLPVKAAPVQYVKVCSLYGAGFYYIPGTDMCIKVSGYVRAQSEWQSNNGIAYGSTYNGIFGTSNIANGRFDRFTDSINMTGRGVISVDARNESEYGTVRGYIRLGAQMLGSGSTTAATFFFDRAFIQFGGFTAGRTQSFFDVFTQTELFTYTDPKTSGDTYNYGVDLLGYTFRFGNGFSASVSAESPRYPQGVLDGSTAAFAINGVTTTDTAGLGVPDFVGNLRLDQNWGYIGISGAIHRVAGRYYGTGNDLAHPDDKYGWAAQIGGLAILPWGDTVGASFVGTKGAIGYATKAGNWQMYNGESVGVGWVADGIFDSSNPFAGGNTPIHLTNAWSVNAAYDHWWNQRWKTSVYGGYTKIWYDGDVTNIINEHLPTPPVGGLACGVPVFGAVWPPVSLGNGAGNSCSPDFSFWQVGSRTQWNITRDFYMGVDISYTHLNTAYKGVGSNPTIIYNGPRPATTIDDQGTWSGVFRTQYSFSPGNEGPSVVFGR